MPRSFFLPFLVAVLRGAFLTVVLLFLTSQSCARSCFVLMRPLVSLPSVLPPLPLFTSLRFLRDRFSFFFPFFALPVRSFSHHLPLLLVLLLPLAQFPPGGYADRRVCPVLLLWICAARPPPFGSAGPFFRSGWCHVFLFHLTCPLGCGFFLLPLVALCRLCGALFWLTAAPGCAPSAPCYLALFVSRFSTSVIDWISPSAPAAARAALEDVLRAECLDWPVLRYVLPWV